MSSPNLRGVFRPPRQWLAFLRRGRAGFPVGARPPTGSAFATAALAAAALAAAGVPRGAVAVPVDPDLIPEARAVLAYLESVYSMRTLSGTSGNDVAGYVYEVSGRLPAIVSFDLCGWNSPTWGKTYTPVVEGAVASARAWWERGGIVAMQFHWKHPDNPEGSAWVGKHGNKPPSGPYDMANVTRPGTPAHDRFMGDLAKHADYLERLAQARVPVLWRPFHEIDGGWFWWTDQQEPEHTAMAWRMMFDYLVRERGLHNLIWVYNPAVHAGGYKKLLRATRAQPTLDDEIAFRKRYYPGPEYCDLAGIDIYPNKAEGYGSPAEDTFPKAWEIMTQVAPGKMLAMCESSAVIHPARIEKDGPRWLYSLQWFEGSAAYVREIYRHPWLLTLDELPTLHPGALPFVRLRGPADGAALEAARAELLAEVAHTGDDAARIEFLALPGPWQNAWLMKAAEKGDWFAGGDVVAVAESPPYRAVWDGIRPGLHTIAARVTDRHGRVSFSNVARVSAGLVNLARAGRASASSRAETASLAVDGDLFTSWNGDKEGEQWLAVDLGAPTAVGAATVSWWKAYARTYQIQVSDDGTAWRTLHTTPAKNEFLGNTDLIRFEPVTCRHLRLLCTRRGTDWGGYTVYELGVYKGLPEP
ncbi:MAG: discoidin domain-containing protein [Lentisphaeria bacterium]|nr:discoidin domain-containing protein [Lentisphaeria bacterium]